MKAFNVHTLRIVMMGILCEAVNSVAGQMGAFRLLWAL